MTARPMTLALALAVGLGAGAAQAANPTVGGAPMLESRNIVENAVNSPIHTTLVAAVQAADLVDTLASPGPFTVFAPVNSGFEALPAGTVEALLQPENKGTLQKILTSHVVAGDLSLDTIRTRARANGGFYHFRAVSGDALSAQVKGNSTYIYDESGNASRITIADVDQSNGVIHVIENVLLPR